MKVSANTLKWVLRLYPPLLFQRIWVKSLDPNFCNIVVKINKSTLNKNGNGSIFGGTISAGGDPYFVVLFYQYFSHKGYQLNAWQKSFQANFLNPAYSTLYLHFKIEPEEIQFAEKCLNEQGKYVHIHSVDAIDSQGKICARLQSEVYLRNLDFPQNENNKA